jgi:transcriptional regulator with GAF, ATPase, and Fis domain
MVPHSLQLALWRAACRHIDIADGVAELAAAVRASVPVGPMRLFAIDAGRCVLAASDPPATTPLDLPTGDTEPIARFAARGGLIRFNADRPGRSLLAGLAPALGPGTHLCGALQRAGVPEGVVTWSPVATTTDFPPEIAETLNAALEPIAIALDTSHRFRELMSLRRAAEADRASALRRLGRDSLAEQVIGEQSGLRAVMDRVSLVARSDVPVLILGETGSGKEVIARTIHERSARHAGPFLRVNCGAIPPDLIDSQLFGHERGAFTGATERRLGWFERADAGTLLLDEIGELPLAAQVRLLRVLQEGVLERVGGQQPVRVDCRIIAATHRDLAEMVRQRAFREDLWYRLAVFPIFVPPLRDRPEDLRPLAEQFAHRAAVRFGLPEFEITLADLQQLAAYHWPGNIRELAAVIDRAALLGRGHRLALDAALGSPEHHISPPRHPATPTTANQRTPTLDDTIRAAIQQALGRSAGKVEGPGGAARALGLNPNTLRSKMKKLGIRPNSPHT